MKAGEREDKEGGIKEGSGGMHGGNEDVSKKTQGTERAKKGGKQG